VLNVNTGCERVARLNKALPPVRFAGVEYEIQAIFNEGDIGLILLHKPVTGIAPIFLYRSSDEAGKTVVLVAHGRAARSAKKKPPDERRAAAINTIDRVATRSMALEVKGPDDASDLQAPRWLSDEDGAPAIVETRDGLFVAGIAIGAQRASVGLVRTGDRDTYAPRLRLCRLGRERDARGRREGSRRAAGDGDRR